jgi:hypothetical protein
MHAREHCSDALIAPTTWVWKKNRRQAARFLTFSALCA